MDQLIHQKCHQILGQEHNSNCHAYDLENYDAYSQLLIFLEHYYIPLFIVEHQAHVDHRLKGVLE